MYKISLILLYSYVVLSCDYLKQDTKEIPIARVNDSYLYKKDIEKLIFNDTSKEDSTLIVNNFINRWATKQLLIDQSIINLPEDQQESYNEMVEQYKIDLYTEAYKSTIITRQLDSVISEEEMTNYYNLNKQNFRLNDELLKVRYIHINENFSNLNNLIKKFKRFNSEDKQELSNLSIKFKANNLNDSVWIKKSVLLRTLPVLKSDNSQVLKKTNFIKLQDSLGVYLVKIEAMLKINDIAPLSYVRPTIKQIVLNKRKQELLKKLEKDITIDAIKNKNFELYTEK